MAYKYIFKAFYNKTNKKKYNLQILWNNIHHINIIAMKDVIIVAEKSGKNKELLAIENVNKIVMAEIGKVLCVIDFRKKHSWTISHIDINIARNLELIDIKKY